ncbi:hypothetical protein VTN77DRAFT_3174 [Rasamsonia byssochlamydoides]|uniref:uncharacterized protein n=1 Tax=Rasamsonia byssochlamydoides TaxID=89139 RepID=UPI00374349D9
MFMIICALKPQNPFAYSAVYHGIQSFRRGQHSKLVLVFDFILNPIRNLLYMDDLPLPRLLLWLQVLELRYRDEYQGTDPVDWRCEFSTAIELHSFMKKKKPEELALELTLKDQSHFRSISAHSILTQDHMFKLINTTWRRRAREAEALAVVSTEYIEILVREFDIRRNFQQSLLSSKG